MQLYEFSIRRSYEDGTVKMSDFQVPAKNQVQAMLKLGRHFPHREENDFKLEVLTCKAVKVGVDVLNRRALVEQILSSTFKEPDWDRDVGECNSIYEISNLFTSQEEAENAAHKILDAYETLILQ